MTFALRDHGIDAVVLDIEGTTTPIAFVHEVLFPFARRALATYVRDHLDAPDVEQALAGLRAEWEQDVARTSGPPSRRRQRLWRGSPKRALRAKAAGGPEVPPPWQERTRDERIASIVAYATWLMDRDRKSFGLKALQGKIWEQGYVSGELRGEVFADVPAALSRWHDAGIAIAIFSSGSVLAQRLLFGHSVHGDLTPWIDAYFDTSVGAKSSPDSYRRIAASLQHAAEQILFISDSTTELEAARAAGYAALLSHRPGNAAFPPTNTPVVHDFDAIMP